MEWVKPRYDDKATKEELDNIIRNISFFLAVKKKEKNNLKEDKQENLTR